MELKMKTIFEVIPCYDAKTKEFVCNAYRCGVCRAQCFNPVPPTICVVCELKNFTIGKKKK